MFPRVILNTEKNRTTSSPSNEFMNRGCRAPRPGLYPWTPFKWRICRYCVMLKEYMKQSSEMYGRAALKVFVSSSSSGSAAIFGLRIVAVTSADGDTSCEPVTMSMTWTNSLIFMFWPVAL